MLGNPLQPILQPVHSDPSDPRFSSGGLTYVKANRAFDGGNLLPFNQPDLSGNDLTATLQSGGYANVVGGSGHRIDFGDIAAAYPTCTQIRAYLRSSTETQAFFDLNVDDSIFATIVADGTWQQKSIELTATASALKFVPNGTIDIAYLELLDASGNVLDVFPLFEGLAGDAMGGKPVISRGGLVGSYTGCLGGQGEGAPIPQVAGVDYNDRMWFDRSDDYVNMGDVPAFETDSFNISLSTIIDKIGNIRYLYSNQFDASSAGGISGWAVRFNNDNTLSLIIAIGDSFDFVTTATTYTSGKLDIEVEKSGTSVTIKVNGSTVKTATVSSSPVDYATGEPKRTAIGAGFAGSSFTLLNSGSIYDVVLKNGSGATLSSWNGYGNTNADWTDQIGSNDGTVNGSPTTLTIPAASATLDALGNPINAATKRPNARATNLRSGEHVAITDDAALDGLNTFWGWYYHDGEDRDIWDLDDGAGSIKLFSTSGDIAATGLTSPSYFVGNTTTEVASGATLSDGWNFIAVTFSDISPGADPRYYGHQGHKLFYDETLTLAQFEQARKATKGTY